jgi:hypothetical protein
MNLSRCLMNGSEDCTNALIEGNICKITNFHLSILLAREIRIARTDLLYLRYFRELHGRGLLYNCHVSESIVLIAILCLHL